MNIIWISAISDNELDLTAAVAKNPKVNLTLYVLSDPNDQNNDYHLGMLTHAPNININVINGSYIDGICEHITTISKDLVILRHPTWIANDGRAKEIQAILKDQPLVCTTWEWVPNIAMSQMPPLTAWNRIAVSNSQDFNRAKLSFPDKQILKLPFGVVPWSKEELTPKKEYESDIMCDAQPHYECKEFNSVKRHSVDTMIGPAIDLRANLALYGSRYGTVSNCDWSYTPKFHPFVRPSFNTKEYPHVYASTKLYLGVSWNYLHGGFSVRLSRSLGCGVPTIWHETIGRELDVPKDVVKWSKDYDSTKTLISYYLDEKHEEERIKLGKDGKKWALDNLEWTKQLARLVKEIQ